MEEHEDKICEFKKYAKQTLNLMTDAYKWKVMAEYCEDLEMKNKYINVSNTLFDLFMKEHEHIGQIFKN